MLKTKTRRIATVLVMACASTSLAADPGPAITGKKIIAFAPVRVDAAYLRKHISEIEKRPIDGLIFSVYPDGWGLRKVYRNMLWFGGAKYTREDFRQAIADLKATKFERFTDNFLDFPTTVSNWPTLMAKAPPPPSYSFANVDWFDDEGWSHVARNGAVAAHVAREGGLKGLLIDAEGYGGGSGLWMPPFSYSSYRGACLTAGLTPRTPEECVAQVRTRGRQWMQAVTEVYPDITIIMIPSIGSTGDAIAPFLGSAFVDGMLEGSGPGVTIVDGMEGGYPLQRYESFLKKREFTESDNIEKSRTPETFKKRVSYGYGLWLDFECGKGRLFPGWHTEEPEKFELNYRTPERLEHSLHHALRLSDRYVWLFTWHSQLWFNPHVRGKANPAQLQDQCPLCPHEDIPQAYMDALTNCRKPHDLHWGEDRMRELEERTWYGGYLPPYMKLQVTAKGLAQMGKDLLANGGFERTDPASEKFAPVSWAISGQDPSATRDQDFVKEGAYSVRLTTTRAKGHVFLDQVIPAEPLAGKFLILGAWLKTDGKGSSADVGILDVDKNGKHEVTTAEHPGNDVWQFVAVRRRIRKNAVGNLTLRISSHAVTGSVIYLDGAIAVVEQ